MILKLTETFQKIRVGIKVLIVTSKEDSKKYVLLQSTNQYQTIQQHTMTNTATGPRKRQRKKRSSAKQQPSMGLASLRQHQNVTLRRSEECLNTSTPESSTSESDHDQGSIAWVLTPTYLLTDLVYTTLLV